MATVKPFAWQWWKKELDWMKAPAAIKPRRTKPDNKRPHRSRLLCICNRYCNIQYVYAE